MKAPQDDDETHPPSRAGLSNEERLALLERDARSHARSLTSIVQAGKSFTSEQLEQLRMALREELADAGLRVDGPDHIDDAREDFRFLRRLRLNWDGATRKVGSSVLWALIVVVGGIISLGFWAWLGKGLGK